MFSETLYLNKFIDEIGNRAHLIFPLTFPYPTPTSGNSANHPAQIVPAHFFSSAHFTSLRPPASQVCSLSSSPQPLAAFPQVFSKRYLISVKAGLPSMQYALTLFVLVGKAEGSSRDSG